MLSSYDCIFPQSFNPRSLGDFWKTIYHSGNLKFYIRILQVAIL